MKLQREYFSVEKDGFFGAYYPNPQATGRCMIALLGDDIDDRMAVYPCPACPMPIVTRSIGRRFRRRPKRAGT